MDSSLNWMKVPYHISFNKCPNTTSWSCTISLFIVCLIFHPLLPPALVLCNPKNPMIPSWYSHFYFSFTSWEQSSSPSSSRIFSIIQALSAHVNILVGFSKMMLHSGHFTPLSRGIDCSPMCLATIVAPEELIVPLLSLHAMLSYNILRALLPGSSNS